jgi:hypothetical protein
MIEELAILQQYLRLKSRRAARIVTDCVCRKCYPKLNRADDLIQALEQADITGIKTIPAEGWNGNTLSFL